MGKDEDDMLPQTCSRGQGKKRVSNMWREDTWGYLKDILPIEALKETLRREGSSLAAALSLKTPPPGSVWMAELGAIKSKSLRMRVRRKVATHHGLHMKAIGRPLKYRWDADPVRFKGVRLFCDHGASTRPEMYEPPT
ncbi:MAG: hypothetical protein SWH78_10935 [Thermodesulfobacteriota bacterium]|nr:hypothetical protein [Thermodesulfobacteriota bacterium]